MNNVEKNEVLEKVKKEQIYIDEESYQHIKEKLCKKDDYFTLEEIEKLA